MLLQEFAADFPAFMANLNMNAICRNTGDVQYSGDEDEIWLLISKCAFSRNVWIFWEVLTGNCQGFFSVFHRSYFSRTLHRLLSLGKYLLLTVIIFLVFETVSFPPFALRVFFRIFRCNFFKWKLIREIFCYFLWNVHVRSIVDQFQKLVIHKLPSTFTSRFLYNFINIVEFTSAKCTRGMFRR